MKNFTMKFIYLLIVVLLTCACSRENAVKSPNNMVVNEAGTELYVADETANRISIIDIENEDKVVHLALEDKPTGLTLSGDEKTLYVTLGGADGELLEIDLVSREIVRALSLGHTPMSPLVSADGHSLYVCNRFDNTVCAIDLSTFSVVKEVEVDREPVAMSLSSSKHMLYIANHLPSGSATNDYHSAKISIVETKSFKLIKAITLPNGANALNKISISPDQRYAYVTHILARYNVPTNQVERGWINTNALSIIDLERNEYLCTVLLDDLDLGAANPYDVQFSYDAKELLVSHTGTNELSIIDVVALHERIDQLGSAATPWVYAQSLAEIQDDLGFIHDLRQRIALQGRGPKAIAVAGDRVFVSMYYSGKIETVALDRSLSSISLGEQPLPSQKRLGEMYFNDATLCKQHWQSCTSCHPGDARVDGLNWDNLNDGMGNPKNTKSMLFAHQTGPAMITGIRENAEVAVRAGIEHVLFTQQSEDVAEAIDAYLKSLRPVPSPHLVNGELSESAQRGEKVFEKARCIQCHSGEYMTDMKKYDVASGMGLEKGRKFDTPTLVELWRTAPYLYNGAAKDMREVLVTYNTSQKHGVTADLTERELDNLIEFCLSR